MSPTSEAPHDSQSGSDDRLTSWKAIAGYLERSVITVQRWEKAEGLPVHRHAHQKQDSVYASKSELDAWRQSRTLLTMDTESPKGGQDTSRPRSAYRLATALVVTGSAVVALGAWRVHASKIAELRRRALVGLAQATQLISSQTASGPLVVRAYREALIAQRYFPGDTALAHAEQRISRDVQLETVPAGATLSFGDGADTIEIGAVSGHRTVRLPRGILHWRAVLRGYVGAEGLVEGSADRLSIRLDRPDSIPPRMVRATGGTFDQRLTHLGAQPAFQLSDYYIDKYEVTNREFRQFVDAEGYRDPRYWKEAFVTPTGERLSFGEAMRSFVDRTGRPGPATWSGGDYPEGQGDYPVTGVSWFEAMAFAAFAGKSLPTIFHWTRAAGIPMNSAIVPFSNFAGKGLAAVGQYRGVSAVGAQDMAGNAKEWCLNETMRGRFILGGAWNEPLYMFNEADGQSPFARGESYGFRLVKYLSPPDPALLRRVDYPRRDFSSERPVSDAVFSVIRGLYTYDRAPLHASVDSTDDSNEHWLEQRVSFDAAYGTERVVAYVFLPRRATSGPLQTVVYFPGSDGIQDRSSGRVDPPLDGAITKSGRALVFPLYKGTYERGDGLDTDYPARTDFYRTHVLAWYKDLGRTLDYIESRRDLDRTRIAYLGFSWGARLGPLFLAVEPRLETAVLLSGGLKFASTYPETDPFNFAPRVTQPVLMLNGRYDYFFPLETSQLPLLHLLGTRPADKMHVVYESGHVLPWTPATEQTLRWLDRYLGPVTR